MLWGLAYRELSDDRYLDLALRAAEHAWSEPAPMGHLCCGAAGQAYAFLCLHRLTGEGGFVDRARTMLDRATTFVGSAGMTQNSLYKGESASRCWRPRSRSRSSPPCRCSKGRAGPHDLRADSHAGSMPRWHPAVRMYFDLDTFVLDAAQALCVALPAAGLPAFLLRLRGRGWALVAPLSVVLTSVAIARRPRARTC